MLRVIRYNIDYAGSVPIKEERIEHSSKEYQSLDTTPRPTRYWEVITLVRLLAAYEKL